MVCALLPLVVTVGLHVGALAAQPPQSQSPARPTIGPSPVVKPAPPELDLNQWLLRMHNASSHKAYVGTFVVMSAAGGMYSSRIWHVCDGDVQMERIDALTGPPRSTLRRNDQVITFLPELRVARAEKRESLGVFPNLRPGGRPGLGHFFPGSAQSVGPSAGLCCCLVAIQTKDSHRFGYR